MLSPSSEHGRTLFVGRALAGTFFLAAALLVWTQQEEYSEHRLVGKNNFNPDKESTSTIVQTYSCKIDQLEMNLAQAPDLIIAGAAKCGTTTMAHWLLDHPNVLPTKKWECHFFNTGIHPHEAEKLLNSNHHNNDNQSKREDLICELRKRYLHQWPDLSQASGSSHRQSSDNSLLLSKERVFTFDKTPDYLFPSRIPQLIKSLFSGTKLPKIVILLRNPVDRAYSHYRMGQRMMREEHIPFEEFIQREIHLLREVGLSDFVWDTTSPTQANKKSYGAPKELSLQQLDNLMDQLSDKLQGHNYLSRGLYAMQLERWFRHGLGQDMLVLPYPELESHPQQVYAKVLEFVGMPPHSLSQDLLHEKFNHNDAIADQMLNSTRLQLTTFFDQSKIDMMDLLKTHNKSFDYDWQALWD